MIEGMYETTEEIYSILSAVPEGVLSGYGLRAGDQCSGFGVSADPELFK